MPNPRRVVLARLRELNENSRYWTGRFDQRQTTTDDGSRTWRPLRDNEKIENSVEAWEDFEIGCLAQVAAWQRMLEYARQNKWRLQHHRQQQL